MKKTLALDDEHHVKGAILECKATEYMVIDRALSMISVNPNVPLETRMIAARMLDTLIEKEVDE